MRNIRRNTLWKKPQKEQKKTSKQNQIREAVLLYDQYRYPKTPEEKAAREDALLTIFRLYDGDIRYISGRLRNRCQLPRPSLTA